MNNAKIKANVHRFNDYVAISLHDGATAYLTFADARQLVFAIMAVTESINNERFVTRINWPLCFMLK